MPVNRVVIDGKLCDEAEVEVLKMALESLRTSMNWNGNGGAVDTDALDKWNAAIRRIQDKLYCRC